MDIKAKVSALESDVEFRIKTLATQQGDKKKTSFCAYTFPFPADGKLLSVEADAPCFVSVYFTPNVSMGTVEVNFGDVRRETILNPVAYPLFSYLPAGKNYVSVVSGGALDSITITVFGSARVVDISPKAAYCLDGQIVYGFFNRYGSYYKTNGQVPLYQGETFDAVLKDSLFYCVSGGENGLYAFRMTLAGITEPPMSLGLNASQAAIAKSGDGFVVAAKCGDGVHILQLDPYMSVIETERLTLPFVAESVGFVKGAQSPILVLTSPEGTYLAE
jgi:hypothetical protein